MRSRQPSRIDLRWITLPVLVCAVACGDDDLSRSADSGVPDTADAARGGDAGPVADRSSCDEMVGNECNGESCCTTIGLPGGTFLMGRSGSGTDQFPDGHFIEQPEHAVTVSPFSLDKYEVTVGRYRSFVAAYDEWRAAGHPSPEEGAHPNIPGTGWQSAWDAALSATGSVLAFEGGCFTPGGPDPAQTWTDGPGDNELLPINCVSWYEAFAFCLWDGGRLPTEAEWEYVAAGGAENRLFPWGETVPGADAELAVYGCYYSGTGSCDAGVENLAPVGSAPMGNGRWGHADLAGSIWEWTFDYFDDEWYGKPEASGTDVAALELAARRVPRGGTWRVPDFYLRSASRLFSFFSSPDGRASSHGLRCARSSADVD